MKMKDSFSANDLDLVLTYLKLGGYRLIDISIEKKTWSILKAFSKTLKMLVWREFIAKLKLSANFVSAIKVLPQETWKYDNIQDKVFHFFTFPFFFFFFTNSSVWL